MRTDGHWFLDDRGRKVLLRGINLAGSSKVPYPDGATHNPDDFSGPVSFVGRPFPLDEVSEHFERLRSWGFNSLRFLTTWEAVEHRGPGEYDTKYLDYLKEIVGMAGDYGFMVFMDPHQDVWSRMTGGDGAPSWTFEKAGLDFRTFPENGAAKLMQVHYPERYEAMEWAFNYMRFGTATMFTLFFGGRLFAPELTVGGENIQDYLQSRYIGAMAQVAGRLRDMEHVIGYGTLNEPSPGYIGVKDLRKFHWHLTPGPNFCGRDSILTGSGVPREVPVYRLKWFKLRKVGNEIVNPDGVRSWAGTDVWREYGVWDREGDGFSLRHDYFATIEGRRINFFHDFLRPFINSFSEKIRQVDDDAMIFIEGDPSDPLIHWGVDDAGGIVNASHWYDRYTLFSKSFNPWFTIDVDSMRLHLGRSGVRKLFRRQLAKLGQASRNIHGGAPTLVGEFGIPFDMGRKRSYRTGNFKRQVQALTLYYDLMDEFMYHTALWNYTPDNDNTWGDQWNLEDLSVYSREQGGRAVRGFSRPYPVRISGEPLGWRYDGRIFVFRYIPDGGETQVFVPRHLRNGTVEVTGGAICEWVGGHLVLRSDSETPVMLTIRSS